MESKEYFVKVMQDYNQNHKGVLETLILIMSTSVQTKIRIYKIKYQHWRQRKLPLMPV